MRAPENILVIHNDRQRCQMILDAVSHLGHAPSCAHSLSEGLRKITSGAFALVFLEARLPDGSGVEGITKIKVNELSPEIVITTTQGSPDEAEQAIANGAWDYIAAPISPELIQLHIDQILDYRTEKGHRGSSLSLDRKEIIGNSKPLAASLNLLAQAAQSDVNVILTGETGTGKELFARAIHANSRRRQGNFVVVDCTALPETLVESVLFGHARGSFTGAYVSQDGLIKQADKGTLFLDEIGELPLAMQKSFLRVIQEHRFRPVGGGSEVTSDFRLVVATHRDLDLMVRLGKFREDLLFRLRSLVIELPPLRERRDDIKDLILHYMDQLYQRYRLAPKQYSSDFWNVTGQYPWPGNIRELIQALEKTLLSAGGESVIHSKHLPTHIRIQVARDRVQSTAKDPEAPAAQLPAPTAPLSLKEFHRTAVSAAEKQYFKDLMEFTAGDIADACRVSGLSRSRLYALLKKYLLPPGPKSH